MRTATVWCKALPSKSVAETIQYILYTSGQSLELQKKKNDRFESAVMKLSKKEKRNRKRKGGGGWGDNSVNQVLPLQI